MKVASAGIESRARWRRWRWRIARALFLYALVPYLVICIFFALLQRRFMYPALRLRAIRTEQIIGHNHLRTVSITTRDGLKLNGWFYPASPVGAGAEAEPTSDSRYVVLYFPGNGGCRLQRLGDCQEFAELGCDVLLFDYRGYGDNPGSPSQSALVADARLVWQYLVDQRHVDASRIIIFGESLGGSVAIHLVAQLCREQAPPAALVVCSTFASMTETAAWHYPYLPVRLLLLDRYESRQQISAVTCPIVMVHGDQDQIVPIEMGQQLFAAAPATSRSGLAKKFIRVSGADHNAIPRSELRRAVEGVRVSIEG